MSNTITQQVSTLSVQLREDTSSKKSLESLRQGIPLEPLPDLPEIDPSVPHAPKRVHHLSEREIKIALANALRYFPEEYHTKLASEFAQELETYGHIYMYRFRPISYPMKAYPVSYYPAKSQQAASIMLMIQNNLDPRVAQFPHELITYGGNGSVLSNWAQYHLLMKYLSEMEEDQTLVMYSGHPLGLFPSHKDAPRVVITNGMVIPNYSTPLDYSKMYAQGVSMYGQMTAGSYCYIGPQGIVHGTTITVLNAGRKYLQTEDLRGKVLVTSGLGGMSGAQPKAGDICGCITVVAEINPAALNKRHEQGWVKEKAETLADCLRRMKEARRNKEVTSIAYLGNIVDLWEALAKEEELLVDLGSDQTSLHNPYNGGYYPAGISFQEANALMASDPSKFEEAVNASLRRHVDAVNKLAARGMKFWDYGNSFLLQASRAKADVMAEDGISFKYPSYVQDIMGDIFSLGFGPFRWVCTSGLEKDLQTTDRLAAETIRKLAETSRLEESKKQYADNLYWITKAEENRLVVGSQARILYSDARGRSAIASAFNKAVLSGELSAPVVISRDHHDVSGTDSPYRETSNIYDGSQFTADMAVQNFVGDAFRGATWVSLHNGGGVGWGEVINGGFGMVLDGSEDAQRRLEMMLKWDVLNGVSRRAWSKNQNALDTIRDAMRDDPKLLITIPNIADEQVINKALQEVKK
eukprot:TRINITY_DN4313_c0_g1_i1.p1 TRINITY_DN4313_c0_g1~~TRINITY_DN4313_c0_g1_i1.p1  ORF type:complete len:696 (-),score=166.13 TRINITY_DN4313_c0_g1_i1:1-2088(-)